MSDHAPAETLFHSAIEASRNHRFDEAERLLRQAFAETAGSLGHRSYLADVLSRGVDLNNVTRLAPFRLNTLIHCGWLHSLVSACPVNARDEPIPWFTYPAIDFLEPRIKPGWSVFEWGSGNSTLWWSSRASRVLSIEHDPKWCEVISSRAPSNVQVRLVKDLHAYADAGINAGPFDAIVIDGLERNRCARSAVKIASAGAIIIFDNSDRKSVRDGLAYLTDAGWKRLDFFGLLPAYLYRTCTSIFYRDDAFLAAGPLPCDVQSCLGPTCAQVLGE